MRRLGVTIAVVGMLAASYGLGRLQLRKTESNSGRRVLYYVDPMHPTYKSDRPGTAPDCGMPLEPVYADGAGSTAMLPPGAVNIDSGTVNLLGIRLSKVERGAIAFTIRGVGRVTPEDTRVYRINSGVDGFIRETFNDSVGVRVAKNQRLATYYSPDFIAAASGFLAANERVPGAAGKEAGRNIQNYTDRLRNLGMSDVQMKAMADGRQVPSSIDVVAPADGHILTRNVSPGLHFTHDMEFYRIADLSRVWVVTEVSEEDARHLHPGVTGSVSAGERQHPLAARVSDSLPQSEAGGASVKVRLEVDNPSFILRPDMVVDVELPLRLPPATTVPLDALVDSGSGTRVYVAKAEGVFEPREVRTGWRSGDTAQILSGVEPGERVVVSAAYLIDSESRLKSTSASRLATDTAIAAVSGAKDPNCGMNVDSHKAAASGNTLVSGGVTYYFCSRQCKEAFEKSSGGSGSTRTKTR